MLGIGCYGNCQVNLQASKWGIIIDAERKQSAVDVQQKKNIFPLKNNKVKTE